MTAEEPGSRSDGRSHRHLAWQFARFLIVGGASFAVDYGIFFVLFHFFDVQYIVASTISFSVSLVLNYFLTLKFVFEAKPGRNIALEFALYIGDDVTDEDGFEAVNALGGYSVHKAVLQDPGFTKSAPFASEFLTAMDQVVDFWADPSYAQLLLAEQKRIHDFVVADKGTAKEALDGLLADWKKVFKEDGKLK